MINPLLTLSIVSHGQAALISRLLDDLNVLALSNVEIIITVNIPEDESKFNILRIPSTIIRNTTRKGFGANHNAAFELSRGLFFVVINPDIRLCDLDIDLLLSAMKDFRVGALAPVVLNSAGEIEDSVRRFPTFIRLIRRVLLRQRKPDYSWNSEPIEVDWAAGMFVVFRREAFKAIGGFDQDRFYMYLEDVDICYRLWLSGWSVMMEPKIAVIHDAQRASRRSMQHLRWHLVSSFRFLTGL